MTKNTPHVWAQRSFWINGGCYHYGSCCSPFYYYNQILRREEKKKRGTDPRVQTRSLRCIEEGQETAG